MCGVRSALRNVKLSNFWTCESPHYSHYCTSATSATPFPDRYVESVELFTSLVQKNIRSVIWVWATPQHTHALIDS